MDTKQCSKCQEVKATTEFGSKGMSRPRKDGSRIPRIRETCKACHTKETGEWAKQNPEQRNGLSLRFYHRHRERLGAERAAKRKEHPEVFYGYHLKATYGITLEEQQAMLVAQGGKCANLGCVATDPGGRFNKWHVDHDHKTGKVRGLLCQACNWTAGVAGDSPERLHGLAEYINSHR